MISPETIERTCTEEDLLDELYNLKNKFVVDVGCGAGELTRHLACKHSRRVWALEVDPTQHTKNCSSADFSDNVSFVLAGAQDIPLENDTADFVFLFKSLHHVPVPLMDQALSEIHRVLKVNGIVHISEPLYAGDLNQVLKIFHDEKEVRQAAIQAIDRAVESGLFQHAKRIFYRLPLHFSNFDEFEASFLHATHTDFHLTPAKVDQVRHKFQSFVQSGDGVTFYHPMRIDLLQKKK